jgi:hypothetical protein
MDIARRCQGLLTFAPSRWASFDPWGMYRQAAFELGYEHGMQKLFSKKLSDDFYEFYGRQFLGKLGVKFQISSSSSQVQNLLKGTTNHPLVHILLQLFLERQFEASKTKVKPNAILPTIRCPNPYARHTSDFRIKCIILRRSASRGEYFFASCACGYAFSFQKTAPQDATMPIVLREARYGETFEREARRLYAVKPSVNYVARTMDLAHIVADRLIKGKKSKYEPNPERVAQWRAKWTKSRSKAVYKLLLSWDREWLSAQRRPPKPPPPPKHRLNKEEDAIIASEIRQAGFALLHAVPPQRITCYAVCVVLGRAGLPLRLARLPLSRAEMARLTESRAEWLKRKIARKVDVA